MRKGGAVLLQGKGGEVAAKVVEKKPQTAL
jgi:hypothetical protein